MCFVNGDTCTGGRLYRRVGFARVVVASEWTVHRHWWQQFPSSAAVVQHRYITIHRTSSVLLAALSHCNSVTPRWCALICMSCPCQSYACHWSGPSYVSCEDLRYEMLFWRHGVRSKADMSQLNLPPTAKKWKAEKLKSTERIRWEVSVNSPGNPGSQSWRRKGRLRWEEFTEKEGFDLWRSVSAYCVSRRKHGVFSVGNLSVYCYCTAASHAFWYCMACHIKICWI